MSDIDRPGGSLSRSLLELLHMIGDSALIDYLKELYADFPVVESEEDRLASERGRELTNSFMRQLVAKRLEPVVGVGGSLWRYESLEFPLEALGGDAVVDSGLLDEFFTVEALRRVGESVDRWRRLRETTLVVQPGRKVTRYLRHATICYLVGLSDAATVLCRSVLEFALKETDDVPLEEDVKLDELIDKVLSSELATKAHRVRRRGNASLHRSSADENEALVQLRETGEVLSHLYGLDAR
jgi:hypothetical protein